MIELNAIPVMMTVLDSEGYRTTRNDRPPEPTCDEMERSETVQSDLVCGQTSKISACDTESKIFDNLRHHLKQKTEECSTVRDELSSVTQSLAKLRHNFVYEVKLLQKAILDLQQGKPGKKPDPDSSLLAEYGKLLIEREKFHRLHDEDTTAIRELKQTITNLMVDRGNKPSRPPSRGASSSPVRNSKPSKTKSTRTLLGTEQLSTIIVSWGKPNVDQSVATQSCCLAETTQTDRRILSYQSHHIFNCDSAAVRSTRDVAILARRIDVAHTVCQTDKFGMDVATVTDRDTASLRFVHESHSIAHINAEDHTVQYVRSNALEESFFDNCFSETPIEHVYSVPLRLSYCITHRAAS